MISCLDREIFVGGLRSLHELCKSSAFFHASYSMFKDKELDVFFLIRCYSSLKYWIVTWRTVIQKKRS